MEGRKVQKVGYSSVAISLPIDWAKNANIKPGDMVFLAPQNDGSLKLIPDKLAKKQPEVEEAILNSNLCNSQGMIERMVVSNYILGRDVIRIIAPVRLDITHLNEIRGILPKLMGLGIIEESPNQIVIQCSIDPEKFEIERAVTRLYIVASLMQKEAIKSLVDGDFELVRQVLDRENEADTMYYLTLRLINFLEQEKSTGKKITDALYALDYRIIVHLLERIADWAEAIAHRVIAIEKNRKDINKDLIRDIGELSEIAYDICNQSMRSIPKTDIAMANEAIIEYSKFKTEEERLMKEVLEKVPNDFVRLQLSFIIHDLRRIAELGTEIAQVAIDRILIENSKICELF